MKNYFPTFEAQGNGKWLSVWDRKLDKRAEIQMPQALFLLPPSENIRRFVKMGPVRKYKALQNKL